MGEVIEIDVDKDGLGWGPFLRVRVWVNITKPLSRGTLLKQEGTPIQISFKYERLSNSYFKCGIILHKSSGCNKDGVGVKLHETEPIQYKTWLRPPMPNYLVRQGPLALKRKAFLYHLLLRKKKKKGKPSVKGMIQTQKGSNISMQLLMLTSTL